MVWPLVVTLAAVGACGGASAHPDAETDANGGSDASGDQSTLTFDLAVEHANGDLVAVEDGASVRTLWGNQGGVMLRPALVLSNAWSEGDTFDVLIVHAPDPEAPEAYDAITLEDPLSVTANARRAADGSLVLGPFDHQLGWSDLDGQRLRYTVTAERDGMKHTETYNLALSSGNEDGPCAAFMTDGDFCSYRRVPGTLTVTKWEDATGAGCGGDTRLKVHFVPVQGAVACIQALGSPESIDLTTSFAASGTCLEAEGLSEGAEIPGTVLVEEHGTCTPEILEEDFMQPCIVEC